MLTAIARDQGSERTSTLGFLSKLPSRISSDLVTAQNQISAKRTQKRGTVPKTLQEALAAFCAS